MTDWREAFERNGHTLGGDLYTDSLVQKSTHIGISDPQDLVFASVRLQPERVTFTLRMRCGNPMLSVNSEFILQEDLTWRVLIRLR